MSEPTFGEKAVGLTFDPSGNEMVNILNQGYADIIDNLDIIRATTQDADIKRMCAVAITEAQTSQMWAFKAVTWQT